jgi:hypothetical protein
MNRAIVCRWLARGLVLAVVVCSACRTTAEQAPDLHKQLKDASPAKRAKAALTLAEANEAEAIPVLIDLLAELPAVERRPIEEFLTKLAGEWAPVVQLPTDDAIDRGVLRDAWASWWRRTDGSVLLAVLAQHTLTPDKRRRLRELVPQLGSDDFRVRESASRKLLAFGWLALPHLREAVQLKLPLEYSQEYSFVVVCYGPGIFVLEQRKCPLMKRACKVSLKFATARKHRAVAALLQSYRAAVNFFLRSLWDHSGGLDAATLARLEKTRLSQRYKSQALKQALEMVTATRQSAAVLGVGASCPVFTGAAVLDGKFVSVEEGRGSFDLIVRLSCLTAGVRLTIPTRKTAVLKKWLVPPLARLVQGCALSETGIVLWVELPDLPSKNEGDVLAVDIGVNKLVSDSEGNHYGTDFKAIRDMVRHRKPGSKGRTRAHRQRSNFINRVLNRLPWERIKIIGHERLHDLKRGPRKGRNKNFRKAISPWVYREVLTRIDQKAQQNRVRVVDYDPRNTSRQCPECGAASKDNRKGERFCCQSCGHADDADTVGARNGLARTLATLGSLESPGKNVDERNDYSWTNSGNTRARAISSAPGGADKTRRRRT